MYSSNYTNGSVGFDRPLADYGHADMGTENSSPIYSEHVSKNTYCEEAREKVTQYRSETESVHCELSPSPSDQYPIYQPIPGAFWPAVHVPGPTVLIVYLFVRTYFGYRVACLSEKSKD